MSFLVSMAGSQFGFEVLKLLELIGMLVNYFWECSRYVFDGFGMSNPNLQ